MNSGHLFYKSSLWPLSLLTAAVKDCLMGVSQLMISANCSLLILSYPALSDCCYFFHVQAGPWQAVGLVNGGRLMVHFVRFRVGSLFNNVGLNHHQLTNMQQALYCFLSFYYFISKSLAHMLNMYFYICFFKGMDKKAKKAV